MAKKDWQVFYTDGWLTGAHDGYSLCWATRSSVAVMYENDPYPVAPGGGSKILSMDARGRYGNNGFGWLYDGPSSSAFPLLNGSVSCAIRATADNPPVQRGIWGVIARAQDKYELEILNSSINAYFIGVYRDSTLDPAINFKAFRIENGADTLLDLGTIECFDYSGSGFAQFECRLVNNSGNVEFWTRYNNGAELTMPGAPGWTSWVLAGTDTTPGVLVNAGYWGIGGYQYSTTYGDRVYSDPEVDYVTIDTSVED